MHSLFFHWKLVSPEERKKGRTWSELQMPTFLASLEPKFYVEQHIKNPRTVTWGKKTYGVLRTVHYFNPISLALWQTRFNQVGLTHAIIIKLGRLQPWT